MYNVLNIINNNNDCHHQPGCLVFSTEARLTLKYFPTQLDNLSQITQAGSLTRAETLQSDIDGEEIIWVSLITRSLLRAATSVNIMEVIRPKYQIFQQKTRKLLSSCCNDSTLSKVDSDKDCAIELSHCHSGYAVRWWNLLRKKQPTQLIREGNIK